MPAQVGGQQPRWQLYHHLYLIEHSGKRTTPLIKGPTALNPQEKRPPSPPPMRHDHPLTDHVDWRLPTRLRVCTCLHAVWTPQVSQQPPKPPLPPPPPRFSNLPPLAPSSLWAPCCWWTCIAVCSNGRKHLHSTAASAFGHTHLTKGCKCQQHRRCMGKHAI